jgi:hypothetical protein
LPFSDFIDSLPFWCAVPTRPTRCSACRNSAPTNLTGPSVGRYRQVGDRTPIRDDPRAGSKRLPRPPCDETHTALATLVGHSRTARSPTTARQHAHGNRLRSRPACRGR